MCFCGTTAKARRFSRTVRDSQKKNIPFSFCRGEFGRKGVGGGFFVPEDADDPPAAAVVEKLDAGAALAFSRRGETSFGNEEGTETIPVAIACGAGDHVIEGMKDGVYRFHVVGFGSGDAGGERGRSRCLLRAERS